TNVSIARALETIPSVGITKSTDENASDAQGFGGLAIRFPVLPFLKLEGGVGYRQDSFSDGDLKVHQWPLTASAWAAPFSMLYGGGGIGWYRTTYDYASELQIEDTTEMTMGVHLGGGLNIPIAPRLGLDLTGPSCFIQKSDQKLQLPTTCNPDFWTTSLGLAISF